MSYHKLQYVFRAKARQVGLTPYLDDLYALPGTLARNVESNMLIAQTYMEIKCYPNLYWLHRTHRVSVGPEPLKNMWKSIFKLVIKGMKYTALLGAVAAVGYIYYRIKNDQSRRLLSTTRFADGLAMEYLDDATIASNTPTPISWSCCRDIVVYGTHGYKHSDIATQVWALDFTGVLPNMPSVESTINAHYSNKGIELDRAKVIEKRHRRLPRCRRRGLFKSVVVNELKNKFGLPQDNPANRLAVRRMALNLVTNYGLRPGHTATIIDDICESVFLPNEHEIQAKGMRNSVLAIMRKFRYYSGWNLWGVGGTD
jgi:hypothetical protein